MWELLWGGVSEAMVATRGHRWSLEELEAQWLEPPTHRYNVGFSFLCPTHWTHRLSVRLDNPYDGLEPVMGPGLLARFIANDEVADGRVSGTLGHLTVVTPAGFDELDFSHMGYGDCGRLRIINGHVERVRY